jgi:hypothetical protein
VEILHRKDAQVEALQAQLAESNKARLAHDNLASIDAEEKRITEGKGRDYFTGRSIAAANLSTGAESETAAGSIGGLTHKELLKTLQQCRQELQDERSAHINTRSELEKAHTTLDSFRAAATSGFLTDPGTSAVNQRVLQPQQFRELRALREQNIDQKEQIQVSISRNSLVRLVVTFFYCLLSVLLSGPYGRARQAPERCTGPNRLGPRPPSSTTGVRQTAP